ncbi:MAG: O-antigen ligase family protein [Symbiobacteriia bacterium]
MVLAVWAFVFAQFVELPLAQTNGFVLSVQKVAAITVLPLAVVFMGRLRIPRGILMLAFGLAVGGAAAYLVSGDFLNILSVLLSVGTGAIGALVLYTALTAEEDALQLFTEAWVLAAAGSAILTFLQSLKAVPMWFVPLEYQYMRDTPFGLLRGVGLRFDPNFQAAVLVIGLAFAQFQSLRYRVVATFMALLGIMATFSRMGLVAATVALVLPFAVQLKGNKKVKSALRLVLVLGLVAGLVGLAYYWGPESLRGYIGQRISETVTAFQDPADISVSTQQHLSSAQTRMLLARAAWMLIIRNWYVGVGGNGTRDAIFRVLGKNNVAHNTYLELMLTGGIWGAVTIAIYGGLIAGVLYRTRRAVGQTDRVLVLSVLLTITVISAFLSLNNTSLIWVPLVVVLSYEKRRTLWGGAP